MDAEVVRTGLEVSNDARVRAGVRAAVEHISGRRGLSKAEQQEFAEEVDAECGKSLTAGDRHRCSCKVVIEEHDDRLEVKVRRADTANRAAAEKRNGNGSRMQDSHTDWKTLARQLHKNSAHS